MKEIVCLHFGQGGVNVGHSLWQLFCLEHNLSADGGVQGNNMGNQHIRTMFSERLGQNFSPRSLLIDSQSSIIDEIQAGTYRNLFHPHSFLSSSENAEHNFAKGYYQIGNKMMEETLNRIRSITEQCSNLEGFIVFSSLGGGTGSGFGSLLTQTLSEQYQKKLKMGINIYPSSSSSVSTVEPLNAMLATHKTMEHLDMSIVIDNQALQQICKRNLDISAPTFLHYNKLISQTVAAQTCSIRFDGALNENLQQMQTNLVTIPRIHFLLSSLSPLISSQRNYHNLMGQQDISNALFEPSNQMVYCDPRQGKFMNITMMYRGDHIPKDVSRSIYNIKISRAIRFANEVTNFKVGINYEPPVVFPHGDLAQVMRSACMISNSTSISSIFIRNSFYLQKMLEKKIFLHPFLQEGLQKSEIEEAREDLGMLEKEYALMEADTIENEDDQE